MTLSEDEQRAATLADRLAPTVTQRELVVLAWLAVERDDIVTKDLLRTYERIRQLRGWTTL